MYHSCVQIVFEVIADPVLWLQIRTLALDNFQPAESLSQLPNEKQMLAVPFFHVHL